MIAIPAIMTLGTIVLPGMLSSFKPFEHPLSELLHYLVFSIYPALLIGGSLFEEIGWRGFALPRLEQRYGPMAASLLLGIIWAFWYMPVWFSGQWRVPTILNMIFFVSWITAATFIYTRIFNNTKGSVLMAILAHASMDAFPQRDPVALGSRSYQADRLSLSLWLSRVNRRLWSTVLSLIFLTRGRVGYQHYRPENAS